MPERARDYGDHVEGGRLTGKVLTALIERHYNIKLPHDIPASLYEQMMAAVKMVRLAYNPVHEDSVLDAQNYLAMSLISAKQEKG